MTGRDIGAQYGAMSRNRTEAKPIRIEHSHINHGPKKRMDIQQTSTTNKTEGMSDTQHANKRSW